MGNLGPLPIPPNTDQLHCVPAWATGANSGCLPSPSVCAGIMVPGEEELDVVLQLLLTPWARDLTPPPPPPPPVYILQITLPISKGGCMD